MASMIEEEIELYTELIKQSFIPRRLAERLSSLDCEIADLLEHNAEEQFQRYLADTNYQDLKNFYRRVLSDFPGYVAKTKEEYATLKSDLEKRTMAYKSYMEVHRQDIEYIAKVGTKEVTEPRISAEETIERLAKCTIMGELGVGAESMSLALELDYRLLFAAVDHAKLAGKSPRELQDRIIHSNKEYIVIL
jgi:hypothetical protein